MLRHASSIEDLRRLARRRLPRAVFEFFDGGAEEEQTLRENRAAFERVRFSPRALVDVSRIDTKALIAGATSALPFAIAPTGAAGFGWRGADVAIARVAAEFGIPFALSTTATASIERIAGEAGGRLWFQAYVLKQREITMQLIERARAADYEALIITVDVPVGGKRERDIRNDFSLPFRFTPRNVLDFASRPSWALDMVLRGMPAMENLVDAASDDTGPAATASSVGRNFDASFDWDSLAAIRDAWPRTLIVKGILRADDAARAAEIGCNGVIVSNHGGRQLDGAVAALDALPAVVSAVGKRMSVMVDGGVRRGGDVVKALALGAEAALIGRATLYGVCAAGEPGVRRALDILRDELVRTMQLCGVPAVRGITPAIVLPGPVAPSARSDTPA